MLHRRTSGGHPDKHSTVLVRPEPLLFNWLTAPQARFAGADGVTEIQCASYPENERILSGRIGIRLPPDFAGSGEEFFK